MKYKSSELEAKQWLEKITGQRQTDREESRALPAYQYGDPSNFIDRMREDRKRAKERVKNKGGWTLSNSIVKDICESYEKGFGNGIKGNGIFPDHIIAGASYHSLHYAERLGYDAGYAKHQRHEAAKGDDWLDTGKACSVVDGDCEACQ